MLKQCSQRLARSLLYKQPSPDLFLLWQTRGIKEDTGIVGLKVDPAARENLRGKLHEVLEALRVIPDDAEYRKQVEATMQYRLKAVESPAADEEVEETLENQLESLIKQCKDELGLIPKMAEWKPWEVPADYKVELLFEEDVQTASPTPPQSKPPEKEEKINKKEEVKEEVAKKAK